MSRIYEALKNAEQIRHGKSLPASTGAQTIETPDRRRSRRWALDIPVLVYGHDLGQEPFHEEAHTLHVNSNGGLLLLSAPVREGQKLLLTNRFTQEEQNCNVVFLGTRHSRTVEAGIAFPETNPNFWQLHTQPEFEAAD